MFFGFAPRKRTYLPILELLPPPAFGERRHRGLARRLVAVGRSGVFVIAKGQRPQPWLAYRRGRGPALCLARWRCAPALWRRGEVKLDRLAAGTRARLGGEFSGAGLKDQRRDLLGAVVADSGAEQPAARAVATRLVRCQSEALAHHASTAGARRPRSPDRRVAEARLKDQCIHFYFDQKGAATRLPPLLCAS